MFTNSRLSIQIGKVEIELAPAYSDRSCAKSPSGFASQWLQSPNSVPRVKILLLTSDPVIFPVA